MMQPSIGMHHTFSRSHAAGYWASGGAATPGAAFNLDRDNGHRLLDTDSWANVVGGAVAGGGDAIRFRKGTHFPQLGIGQLSASYPLADNWAWTGGDAPIVHIHHEAQATEGDTSALYAELTTEASSGGAGTIPDSSAISAVLYQITAGANGAGRALEFHAMRGHASAGAHADATWLGFEGVIATAASGNASFGTGGAFPKTIGGWLASYQDGVMAGLGVAAVPADVGHYVSGAAGFRYPFFYHDPSNNIDFYVDRQGLVRGTSDANAAAPTFGAVGDDDTGDFWGGANVWARTAGGIETDRGYSLSATHAAVKIARSFNLGGTLTPATVTGNQNNWFPLDAVSGASLEASSIVRVTTDASRTITGMVAMEGGTVITICNIGAQNLVLAHNDTGNSTAANCFVLPNSANLTLLPNMSVILFYDGTAAKWRCLSGFVS